MEEISVLLKDASVSFLCTLFPRSGPSDSETRDENRDMSRGTRSNVNLRTCRSTSFRNRRDDSVFSPTLQSPVLV